MLVLDELVKRLGSVEGKHVGRVAAWSHLDRLRREAVLCQEPVVALGGELTGKVCVTSSASRMLAISGRQPPQPVPALQHFLIASSVVCPLSATS